MRTRTDEAVQRAARFRRPCGGDRAGLLVSLSLLLLLIAGCGKAKEPFGVTAVADPALVSVSRLTSPVRPGDQAYLTVQTQPEADCQPDFIWPVDGQEPERLNRKTAGPLGVVEWNWKVRADTVAPQSATIEVTCRIRGQRYITTATLEVKP